MSKPVDTLLQREMSRKEFLLTLGFGMASVLGFSSIIHLLTGRSIHSQFGRQATNGYGSTPYGGGHD